MKSKTKAILYFIAAGALLVVLVSFKNKKQKTSNVAGDKKKKIKK